MGDISQGAGFNPSILPAGLSYEDLVSKLDDSTRQKLQQASQALQTVQLTHSLLSNYKPYRDLTKTISETVFDPVKAEFKQATGNLVKNIAGKFNPTGEGDGGISASLINMLGDNPTELLKLAKNPKMLGKSILNRAIENSNLTAEEKRIAIAASKGDISTKSAGKAILNRVVDKADIPLEAKTLARSAAEGRVGGAEAKQLANSLIEKSSLSSDIKSLAKSSIESGGIDTQKAIKTALDRAPLSPEARMLADKAVAGELPKLSDAKDILNGLIDKTELPAEQKALVKAAASGSKSKFLSEAKNNVSKAIDNSNIDPDVKSVINDAVSGKEITSEARQFMGEFLDNSDMPAPAKLLTKSLISGDKKVIAKSATDLLNDTIEKTDTTPEIKNLVKNVATGKNPSISEGKAAIASSLPAEIKSQLPEFENLADIPSEVTKPAGLAKNIVNRVIDKMPAKLYDNLKSAGLEDDEIAANASRNIDFEKLIREAPNKFIDPTTYSLDAPDLGLSDAIKAYRNSKYIAKLGAPSTESGAQVGDSTIARVLKSNASEAIPQVKEGSYIPKSKAQIKQEARARKTGSVAPEEQQSLPPEQRPGIPVTPQINQSREIADPALDSFVKETAKIPPKTSPVPEEEVPSGLSLSDIASEGLGVGVGALGLEQAIQQKSTGQEVLAGTQLGADIGGKALMAAAPEAGEVTGEAAKTAGSTVSKSASQLQKATDESLEGDEDPLGGVVSGVLELATLGTMLAGIFAPKPKLPPIVGGYQSGV